MKLFKNTTIPYGAAIMVELHENVVNTTKNHFVRVFYKNVTYNSDNEVQLTIPGMTYVEHKFKQR